jgi:imidazolonepropionase-like amidohydrolase
MESDAPEALLDELAGSATALSATLGALSRPPLPAQWAAAVPHMRAAFGRVHDGGGTVLVGTDAGINRYKPHDVMPRAMADLVDLGMTPVEALTAMTSRAADTLGLPQVGRLAAGAVADIVAVDGDPFSDPGALTAISRVWRAGVAVEPTRDRG